MKTSSSLLGKTLLWMLILYIATAMYFGIVELFNHPDRAKETFLIILLMGWLMIAVSFTPLGQLGYDGSESSSMLQMVFWVWMGASITLGTLHHAYREHRRDKIIGE